MENLSTEDKDFLAQCEEELKDRYTENDKDFMEVFNAEPADPPILDNWWVSQNYGRRGRGENRRYDHSSNRNTDRNYENRGYHSRGYQDRGYQDRGYQERGYQRGYQDRSYEERGSQDRGYGAYPKRGRQ